MDGDLDNALYQLQKAVEKQNELQDEANNLMRSLIPAIQGLAQEIADWREEQTS